MENKTYQELLDFWFSEAVEKLWFNATPAFDEELRQKYEALYLSALNSELESWREDPLGALALVILFDQIPLNIYRKQKESFQTEARAREVAQDVIDAGKDSLLSDKQKMFLYLPYMHSESLQDQDSSVALFEKAGMLENAKYARHHRKIVARFGRFPHRNQALGRKSTLDELAYLASDEAFLG